MKVSRKRKGNADIPTASTGDIAFLMIIFFMATTKFDVKEGIKLVLPKAAEENSEQTQSLTLTEKEMTRMQIQADGTIVINKEAPRRFENNDLEALIKAKQEMNPKMLFKVITDREAKYSDMVNVLDRLKAQKAENISLSTN
ncbi:MAG TPA: biopolymer transporter ExbD [Candidatus Cloacimonadota bacterium]|nr:biopolymer transporter ExbD [Candidatus Cloacimonadota bacterium]